MEKNISSSILITLFYSDEENCRVQPYATFSKLIHFFDFLVKISKQNGSADNEVKKTEFENILKVFFI